MTRANAGVDSVMAKARQSKAFRTSQAFRTWLSKNGGTAIELYVRCYKVQHRAAGITHREALDEALCFGWIDGVLHRIDEVSFSVRFTPRRPGSLWSRVNVARAQALIAERRMQQSGADAFARRKPSAYSFESRPVALSPALTRRLRDAADAWQFFNSQPPSYRRTASYWVMSAKRDETRERRFEVLLSCSANLLRIPPLQTSARGDTSVIDRPSASRRQAKGN